MESIFERKKAIHDCIIDTQTYASPVPMAAPVTPSPAPGMRMSAPSRLTVRVGKIKKKLKMTSKAHTVTLSMLGTRMLPSHFSIDDAMLFIWKNGAASEKIRKYRLASGAMSAPPPSQ